jgi:hypothetical protein
MARNLTRNTKVYVSSQSVLGSCTNLNTWEIKVLDGYNFSQATTTEDITISEAGVAPTRGQKTFNVAVEPPEVTMSTYIRPYDNGTPLVDAPERILWASLAGSAFVIDGNGDMVVTTPGNGSAIEQTVSQMNIDFEESDSNELAKLTIWFHLENSTYRVDNVNLSSAEIDFAIDDIATIAWSGMGTAVTELSAADHATIAAWTAGTDYVAVPASTSDSFLRNKLSTMTLQNTEVEATALITALSATSGTTNTITDTGETFITDAIMAVGDYVRYSDDAFATWETRVIASFTEDTITIEGTFDTTPSTGQYEIYAAADLAGQNYTIAITGGSLTIENNMNFLTPEELGVVNQPLPGFAETRAVSGSITAYLDTGFYGTAALLADLLENINSVTNSYNFVLSVGGAASTKRVDLTLGTAQIAIPTINVEDVIATEITFSGQGSAGLIENQDELTVTYVA